MLGRLTKAFQTNAPANGGSYTYDTRGRLSARTVTQSTAPTTTTTFYVYDLADHLIAEVNASGQTLKEYIWLDDIPVAVVDGVNTSTPAIYTVHVDHLKRPIRMIAANGIWAWDVDYAPFGGTAYLYTNPEVMNGRFPGQWFQLETGLAYNWHRHYDPTLGRYIQPDPLIVDEGDAAVAGISPTALPGGGNTGNAPALAAGWRIDADFMTAYNAVRPMLQDWPSLYGYAGQSPMTKVDPQGLLLSPIPKPTRGSNRSIACGGSGRNRAVPTITPVDAPGRGPSAEGCWLRLETPYGIGSICLYQCSGGGLENRYNPVGSCPSHLYFSE